MLCKSRVLVSESKQQRVDVIEAVFGVVAVSERSPSAAWDMLAGEGVSGTVEVVRTRQVLH